MISKQDYEAAVAAKSEAESVINQYHQDRQAAFEKRIVENPIFTDEELIYSRDSLCTCGYGIAYPRDCGPLHYWDCSAILKGTADQSVKHTVPLPFAFYDVKAETPEQTTRGVFRPRPVSGSIDVIR